MQPEEEKDKYKDRRLTYLEMPNRFRQMANDVNTQTRVSQRVCEALARHLAKQRPKTPEEFERVSYLKEFVQKTAEHNERVINLLKYMHGLLKQVAEDSDILVDGASTIELLRDRSDHIEALMDQTTLIEQLKYERNKRRQNTGNPK